MTAEQFLVFVFSVFALLQFLAGALKRRRAGESEHDAATELEPDMPGEHYWDVPPEPTRPEIAIEAPRWVAVPAARMPEQPAPRPRPQPRAREPRGRAIEPVRLENAWKVRLAGGDRAELRRAIALMAILGPPRSLDPPDR